MAFDMRRIIRALGSPRLAAATMAAWVLLIVVWVVPFQVYGLPNAQIKTIVYNELFFRFVYAVLAVNTFACIVPRVAAALRKTRREPRPESRPKPRADALEVDGRWDAVRAAASLSAAGFRRTVVGEGFVWGVRNRVSPLGTALFHLGLFAILAGALLSLDPAATFRGNVVLAEGETFNGAVEAYTDVTTPDARVPDVAFTLDEVHPEFYEDLLLFTHLDAALTDTRGRSHRMSLAAPWIVSPTTFVAIEDFGYAPVVSAMPASRIATAGPDVYKLKAFPSGLQDSFDFKGVGPNDYNLTVQIYGDYIDVDGKPASRSFNLVDPRISVSVARLLSNRQVKPIGVDRLVALGEPIEVRGDTIVFEDILYYGVFRVVRSIAAPVLFVGLIVVVAGALLRLVFPRQEGMFLDDAGTVKLVVSDDTYHHASARSARLVRSWGERG